MLQHATRLVIMAMLLALTVGVSSRRGASAGEPPIPPDTGGQLDNSFGGDGKRLVPIPKGGDTYGQQYSVAVQPDRKIILAGTIYTGGSDAHSFVSRLWPNGGFNRRFGRDGTVQLGGRTYEMTLQPDGKIILVGEVACVEQGCRNRFLVQRLNRDGTRDRSFAGDGTKSFYFPYSDAAAYSVDIDSRERIVVAGFVDHSDYNLALARLLPNGRFDRNFGTDGRVVVWADDGVTLIGHSVAVTGEDWVVPAGSEFVAALFGRAGGLRKKFGAGGFVPRPGYSAKDVDVLKDGRIVSLGGQQGNPTALRLLPDGSPDDSFGNAGVASFDDGGTEGGAVHRGRPLLLWEELYSDGSFGWAGFGLGRFTRGGLPDPSFGNSGVVRVFFSDIVYPTDVAIGPNSEIVAVGKTWKHLAVARYRWD
jgi:uncharacterized delta-60 repeat protein